MTVGCEEMSPLLEYFLRGFMVCAGLALLVMVVAIMWAVSRG